MPNKEIADLRQVVEKLVPMLAGKGLKVTQMGKGAYVKVDTRTAKPILVNIPNIPDTATPEFVRAIQGFIDHEVAHVLITDFAYTSVGGAGYIDHSSKRGKRFHNLHNIVEDTMIEREMGKLFPGSVRNIHDLREHFIAKISEPAIAAAKTPQEAFGYMIVPAMRALAGHVEFQKQMDDGDYWSQPLIKALVDGLSEDTKRKLPKLTKTSETYAVAKEMEAILYPPRPPICHDVTHEATEDSSAELVTLKITGGAPHTLGFTKPEHGEVHTAGTSLFYKPAGSFTGADSFTYWASNEDDKSAPATVSVDVVAAELPEPKPFTPPSLDDEDEEEGAEDHDEPEDDDESESEDKPEKEAGAGDGDGERDHDEEEGDDEDDDEGGDADAEPGADDEAAGDGEDDDAGGADDADGDALGGAARDALDGEEDDDTDFSDDDFEADDAAPGTEEGAGGLEGDESPDGEATTAGGGDDDETASPFDTDPLDDEALERKDMSSAIADEIGREAAEMLRRAPYTVYTRDFDRIEPVKVPAADFEKVCGYVVELEEETRQMIGRMQKDIERMLASLGYVVNVPGYRSGRVHPANLHRLMVGDDRIFSRRQEHKSKDTAVSLLVDNSGSMGGRKCETAMIAAYALASTLEKVNIPCEVLGFTTTSMSGDLPKTIRDQIAEDFRSSGIAWSRATPIYMPIFKGFSERINSTVKQRMAYVAKVQSELRQNIDGECVQYAAERLAKRREKRKVLIVLSDGEPACPGTRNLRGHLADTVEDVEKAGIETIGIGILSEAVEHYYPKHVVLNSIADLPGEVMSRLKQILA